MRGDLSRPHTGGDVLLFLTDGIGVDRCRAELGMTHPLRKHVQRDAFHGGINAEPVAQTLGAAVWRVRDIRLDHHALDDLPDADTGERPDRCLGLLGRSLGLADAMGGVQGIEIVWRDGNGPVDDPGPPLGVLALLEAADRDGAAGEIDTGWGNLDQLRGAASGMVQRLAERPVASRPTTGDIKEGGAFLGVQVQPISVTVIKAHFAHI